jgi:vesicle-fusing ATPase
VSNIISFLQTYLCNHILTRDQVLFVRVQNELTQTNQAFLLKVTKLETFVKPESKVKGKETETKQQQEKKVVALCHDVKQMAIRGLLFENTNIKITVEKDSVKWIQLQEVEQTPLDMDDKSFEELGIGGLNKEFGTILRRAFASRLFPSSIIKELGIPHVKGLLLYGPPGTGKTLIARTIGQLLKGKEPKIVNGPEILNKYVGQGEENVRNLFKDAEEEWAAKGDKSSLHVIIFDEIDAICKARGSMNNNGFQDTLVNQILAKIDGVKSPNNFLVIGMTNRKELLDPALLRPGRLEVHIEIGLPDEKGREQIFFIHTKIMRESKRLGSDVDLAELARLTKNYSGAEIQGLVKDASSFALYGNVDCDNSNNKFEIRNKDEKEKKILVLREHFLRAIDESQPAFGADEDELHTLCRDDSFCLFSNPVKKIVHLGQEWCKQVLTKTPLLSILLNGTDGCGKTSLAAYIAQKSEFPYVKVIRPENFVGHSDTAKIAAFSRVFEDAYKSPASLILLDNIERLLGYTRFGQQFSNAILQTLLVLIKKTPPKDGRKLLILATTNHPQLLERMELKQAFKRIVHVPQMTSSEAILSVLQYKFPKLDRKVCLSIANVFPTPISIQDVTSVIEMVQSKEITSDNKLLDAFKEHYQQHQEEQKTQDDNEGDNDIL